MGTQEGSINDFGLLIGYIVPGATVLAGLSLFSTSLRSWFAVSSVDVPTIGGFLYLTVASLATGMAVSAVRWAVVDTLHAWTGLRSPPLDFSHLGRNVEAIRLLIEIHYRHYLFYGNAVIASAMAYACYRVRLGGIWPVGWADAAFVMLEFIFLAASRDTLRKYLDRAAQILSLHGPKQRFQAPSAASRARSVINDGKVPAPTAERSPLP